MGWAWDTGALDFNLRTTEQFRKIFKEILTEKLGEKDSKFLFSYNGLLVGVSTEKPCL